MSTNVHYNRCCTFCVRLAHLLLEEYLVVATLAGPLKTVGAIHLMDTWAVLIKTESIRNLHMFQRDWRERLVAVVGLSEGKALACSAAITRAWACLRLQRWYGPAYLPKQCSAPCCWCPRGEEGEQQGQNLHQPNTKCPRASRVSSLLSLIYINKLTLIAC